MPLTTDSLRGEPNYKIVALKDHDATTYEVHKDDIPVRQFTDRHDAEDFVMKLVAAGS